MSSKEDIFKATVRKALVITMSNYTCDLYSPLPGGVADRDAMSEFLKESCNFEVENLHDDTADKVTAKFKDYATLASSVQQKHKFALFFIYYSGHGTIQNSLSCGHDPFGTLLFTQLSLTVSL